MAHPIETAGVRLLYMPPYSPDFSPIEMAFSKLRALFRKTEKPTVGTLWNTIGQLVDSFMTGESAKFFKAAGYDAD